MTHVHSSESAGSVSPSTPRQRHSKMTLFCPRCQHESPVDGDWVLTLRPDAIEIHCPDCRTLLTTRPDQVTAKERSVISR